MNHSLINFAKRFSRNQNGAIAIQFALISVPMVALSGVAVDYSNAVSIRKQLQDIADTTVLAGARLPATTSDKRMSDATHILNAALASARLTGAKTNIEANNANVRIEASYTYKTHLMNLLGVDSMTINVEAGAQSQVENGGVACLIALNETTDDGLHLQGINKVSSKNCWTWVNSNSPSAINAVGASTGTGQGFCSHGGAVGAEHFDPQPYTECDVIEDPFKEKFRSFVPAGSMACRETDLQLKSGTYVLEPGVYCGDTVLKPHANVTMTPGTYIFRGGYLEVQGQASLTGQGVTLYFEGGDTQLIVRGGGNAELKAPTDGDLAGFVIAAPDTFASVRETIIQGGGRVNIEGVLYAPKWRMNIGGNGAINADVNYFAMVADHYYMEGNGRLYVQSNAALARLPDLMPRIKTGPRLIY